MSDKLDDRTFEIIYGQLARFMLQLFALDFDQIGNLPDASSPLRLPLTMTANEINIYSGAKVMGIFYPPPTLVLFSEILTAAG